MRQVESIEDKSFELEYVEENKVIIQDNGSIFVKWKGSKKFVFVEREIGEFIIGMWAIGKEEYNRRKECIQNGGARWW